MSASTSAVSDKALIDLLGRHGLPVTLARLMVLQIITQADARHLTTEQLCAAMVKMDGGLGFSTFKAAIYDLANAGVLARVVVPHEKRGRTQLYELADKPTHRHLYCRMCQHIEEVVDAELESRIAGRIAQIGLKSVSIDDALPGVCATCAAQALGSR